MRICPKCSKQVSDESKICRQCGAILEEVEEDGLRGDSPKPETSAPPAGPAPQSQDRDERMWATLCHLSAFAFFILPAFGHVVGPLVVWLIKKDQFRLVDDQGREALNFQISATIYSLVATILICAVVGAVLLPAVVIFDIVVTIIAAVKASTGVAYRYPLCIRLLK